MLDMGAMQDFCSDFPLDAEPDLDAAVDRSLSLLPDDGWPITVLVNDPQRATATTPVLECIAMRRKLHLVVATGTHYFTSAQKSAFEERLLDGMDLGVYWHDCEPPRRRPCESVMGYPWPNYVVGGQVLAIGSVEPHYFAGFTGAHKTLTVGIALFNAIRDNHAKALSPECRPGRLEGNPVHEGICEMVAEMERECTVAAINLVQVGDEIVHACAGTPLDALASATPVARRCYIRQTSEPADAVIAEVAGPLASTFYQADKGIKNNEWAVRDGGALILSAACEGGIGQDHFVGLLREAATHAEALRLVNDRGYRLGDHKAVKLRYLTDPATRGVRLLLACPGLTEEQARLLGGEKVESVGKALALAGLDPATHRLCRVRDAGNCCLLPRS